MIILRFAFILLILLGILESSLFLDFLVPGLKTVGLSSEHSGDSFSRTPHVCCIVSKTYSSHFA